MIVVQNKIDVYQSHINQKNWQEAFPNIVAFHETSCKEGIGIEQLQTLVTKELLQLPNTREIWNKDRFAIREALEAKEEDYMTHAQYLQICEQHHLTRQAAGFLSQQLHDIGVILHFRDEVALKNTVVLKPEWATEAAYCLLNSALVKEGKFNARQLEDIWVDARFDDRHHFLLGIARRFELIFQLDNRGNYIIPRLLPPESPKKLARFTSKAPEEKLLRFEYHYDFMPKDVLSRFICRIHQQILEKLFWRYGVVLQREGSRAIISLNDAAAIKVIKIEAWGPAADKLLYTIRSHFEHLHEELNHPPHQEMIPCACAPCQAEGSKTHYFEKGFLEKNLQAGIPKLICNNSSAVSIQTLLEGIQDVNQEHLRSFSHLLSAADLPGFFAKIDELGIKDHRIADMREEFMDGKQDHQFVPRLKTWVQHRFGGNKPGMYEIVE